MPTPAAGAALPWPLALAGPTVGTAPLLALLAVSTLISEDLACVAAGVLVATGRLPFAAATAACAFGILAGDLLLWGLGRLLGRRWLDEGGATDPGAPGVGQPLGWARRWLARVLPPERVARAGRWVQRRGPVAAMLTRFLPGTRVPALVALGVLGRGSWLLFGAFTLAVALWTPPLVALSAAGAAPALDRLAAAGRWAPVVLGAVVLVLWGSLVALPPLVAALSTRRGRRRLLVAWHRRWRPKRPLRCASPAAP